jgi:hypothetical protein
VPATFGPRNESLRNFLGGEAIEPLDDGPFAIPSDLNVRLVPDTCDAAHEPVVSYEEVSVADAMNIATF